jgi:hypothetical protein
LRETGVPQAIRTYVVARGLQNELYSSTANGASGMAAVMTCAMLKGPPPPGPPLPTGMHYRPPLQYHEAFKDLAMPPPAGGDDLGTGVRAAFVRLQAGDGVERALITNDATACYSARLSPAADKSAAAGGVAEAKVRLRTISAVPDWMVVLHTEWTAPSPEAVLQELEVQKSFLHGLRAANPFKSPPSKRRQ